MAKNIALAGFAILTLLLGFSSSAIDISVFGQDSSDREQERQEERQKQAEERNQQREQQVQERTQATSERSEENRAEAQKRLEENRAEAQKRLEENRAEAQKRLEENRAEAQKRLEENRAEAQKRLEENRESDQQKIEERKKVAREKLDQQREEARKMAAQKREETRDWSEEEREHYTEELAEKRTELQEKSSQKRAEHVDEVRDRGAEIRDIADEKRTELQDAAIHEREDLRIKILEGREDLKIKIQDKKDEIKLKLKQKSLDKAMLAARDSLEKARDVAQDKIKQRMAVEIRDNAIDRARQLTLQTDRATFELGQNTPSEISEKISSVVPEMAGDISREDVRIKISQEIRDSALYKSDLIKEKIKQLGQDKFQDLRIEYKDKVMQTAKDNYQNLRDKVKSSGLIDQVDDGTYYGGYPDIPDDEALNYVYSFQGEAISIPDESLVKTISGQVMMDLLKLGDNHSMLRVIGGDITVSRPGDETDIHNVYDVSFGRARVLFDNNAFQVTINTIDLNDKHGSFVMRGETQGAFPLQLGDVMEVHDTKTKSRAAGEWKIDYVGTLSIDESIPITEFQDVELDVQANIVSDDLVAEATDEYLDEIDVSLTDLFTEEELADFTDEEIQEIEIELEAEILAELEYEVVQEIHDEIIDDVEVAINEAESSNQPQSDTP